MRVGLRYDMRAPDLGARSTTSAQIFDAAVAQAKWADDVGVDTIYIAEHHGAEDGYCPSPIVLAAAMAAVTSRVMFHLSALCITLHDPVRLAEDLAVLDLIAGPNRVAVTAGMGYRRSEYQMLAVEFEDRASLFESNLALMQRAWRGEEVDYRDARFRVTPQPATAAGPTIYIGGSARPSARRAAKLGLGYRPATEELYRYYRDCCLAEGRPEPEPFPEHGPAFIFVTEDPDRDWKALAPNLIHASNSYARWAKERENAPNNGYWQEQSGLEALKADEQMWIVTPTELLTRCAGLPDDYELRFHPLLGGIAPELSWGSLKLFERRVLPYLNAAVTPPTV